MLKIRKIVTDHRMPGPAREAPTGPAKPDNRASLRTTTVFRVVRINTSLESGLCRLRNISDQGMMLATGLQLEVGETVAVTLSETLSLGGSVAWVNNGHLGVQFDQSVDSAAILQALASERITGAQRALRLPVNTLAFASSEHGLQAVRILNISQQGMRVAHDRSFRPGMRVKIALENGLERRGVVRWSENAVAGLRLLEPIALSELENAACI